MSTDLDRIVQVNITRTTAVPTMASFSGILIAGEFLIAKTTPAFSTRTREYGSLSEMVAEGWTDSDVLYKMASAIWMQNPAVNKIYVGRKKTGADGTEDWDDAIDAMAVESSAWYGAVVATRTEADQQKIADWAETSSRFVLFYSSDADVVDAASGDIADYLETEGYSRSAVIYHSGTGATDQYADGAWMGKMFVEQPGSVTWSLKTLTGVSSIALTSAQVTKATGKHANFYISVSDINITQDGTVGSGEYIDVIIGIDWLKARIQNLVFTALTQQKKVPYTNAGVDVVTNQLKKALQEAVNYGILASYTVSVPKVENVSSAKKSGRILPDVAFTGVLAGAIHYVEIAGNVSL